MRGGRRGRGEHSRKVTAGLGVLDLLFIEEPGQGDNVGVDLFRLSVGHDGGIVVVVVVVVAVVLVATDGPRA